MSKRQRSRPIWPWVVVALGLLVVVVGVGSYVAQQQAQTQQPAPQTPPVHKPVSEYRAFIYGGLPKADEPLTILRNKGYIVGYSEKHKDPAWVAYRLFRVDNPPTLPRPKRFLVDDRTEARVKHSDYTGTGYDRGHMAPNHAIATRYGKQAQLETFLMSNICPQRPSLNRQLWRRLESIAANDYANRLEEIWVIVGPIFGEDGGRLPGGVDVPVSFYKIIVDEVAGKPRMLAFIMRQEVRGDEAPRLFLTSIDKIEARAGIDFFPMLKDSIEDVVEAEDNDDMWGAE